MSASARTRSGPFETDFDIADTHTVPAFERLRPVRSHAHAVQQRSIHAANIRQYILRTPALDYRVATRRMPPIIVG